MRETMWKTAHSSRYSRRSGLRKHGQILALFPSRGSALKTKKVRRELNETEASKETTDLIKLQMNYEDYKASLKREGFNHEVFGLDISKAFVVKRSPTNKERIKKLIDKGATFSASGIFLHTGNMVITSHDITDAQKQHTTKTQGKRW